MNDYKNLGRREFIAIAGTTVLGVMVGHAAEVEVEPRFVSLREAHIGTLEIDLRIMNQFEAQPQEVQEFYSACREALTGDNPDQDLASICRKHKRWKLGGPMLGDVCTTSVAVWIHVPEPRSVDVLVTPENGGDALTFQSKGDTRIQSIRCEGLSPDTAYRYEVTDSKNRNLGKGRFMTPPTELSEEPFRIAFGADFHKVGMYRPELMRQVRERGSRAMLLIGDSAVDGRKDDFGLINADYLLRNLSPPIQQMTANVPVSATWDDHDYWGNDTSGTSTKSGKSIDVDGLRRAWKSQWNNPERDVERRGIYFQTQIGPVHYIALDTRSCRVNEQRGKLNCFLGDEQMEWLRNQITNSTSPYIILSGGTMWSDNITAGKDSWGTWDTEGREEIFKLIDGKADTQVILLSGDRHGARGFAIPRPDGGKIYELEVGTLGGVPGPDAYGANPEEQIFGYPSRTWFFGELTFGTKSGVPYAIFRLINENDEVVETIVLDRPNG